MTQSDSNASATAGASNALVDTPDVADDAVLAALDRGIAEAVKKVDSGRVYDAENERVRIKWIRALCYAIDTRRKIAESAELDVLAERVEQLEDAQQQDSPDDHGSEAVTLALDSDPE